MTNKLRKFMKTFIISLVLLLGLGPYSNTYTQASESQASTNVKIYYDREDPSGWDVWLWADEVEGAAHPFDKKDEKGSYAEITIDKTITEVTYIVRKSDWSDREPSDKEDGSRSLAITD